MIKNKFNIYALLVAFTLLVVAVAGIFICSPTVFAQENSSFEFYQGKYDNFTDSDSFVGGSIQIYEELLYKNTSNITKNGTIYNLNVTADDPIVRIIPKELFANNGEFLYIGKEYGFFVLTKPSNFSYKNEDNNWATVFSALNKTSFVLVFDIVNEFNVNSNDGVISTSINPLFQYEFLYISKNANNVAIADNNGYDNTDYRFAANYSINQDFVVPAARINLLNNVKYEEENRFYLKDISFGMNLSNEQEYNQGNGNKYNPYNDIGSYFTYLDYEYDGIVRKNGEFPVDESIMLAEHAVDLGLGIAKLIPGLSEAISAVELGLKIGRTASDLLEIGLGFHNFANKQNVKINSGNITAKNYFANRDDQISNYGQIIKSAGFAINTDKEDSIWYGKGNSCKGYFQIGHTALNGQLPNYTRLSRALAIKVVDINGYEIVNSSNQDFMLRSPNCKVLKIDKNEDIILLPNGVNYFNFSPSYTSDYTIQLEGINNYLISLNGETLQGVENEYATKIFKNTNNVLKIQKIDAGMIGKIKISPNKNSDLSINSRDEYIISNAIYGFKTITTGNSNLKFKAVFLVDNGNLINAEFNIKEKSDKFESYFSNKTYYFIIENILSNTQTANITINDIASLNFNMDKIIDISFNGKILEFSSTVAKDYMLSLSATNLVINFYDVNGQLKNVERFTDLNNIARFSLKANEKIYIKVSTTASVTNKSTTLKIKDTENAFIWYVNGQKCTTKSIEIPRGSTSTFYCMINDTVKVNNFLVINSEYYDGISLTNSSITISSTSKMYGWGFDIIALADIDASNLKVTPIFEGIINFSNAKNTNDDIGFEWNQKFYVEQIQVEISLGGISKLYVYSGAKGYGNNNYVSIFNDYKNINSIADIKIMVKNVKIKDVNGSILDLSASSNIIYINAAFGGGNGTSENPFVISSVRHFNNISRSAKENLYYKQNCVLDFNGTRPVTSTYEFYGDLDGSVGSLITGVTINSGDAFVGGLFKYNFGNIHNFFGITVDITATNSQAEVGAIAAVNYGKLVLNMTTGRIHSKGTTRGTGGFAGTNFGLIKSSVNQIVLTSTGDVGGFAGRNYGEILNCVNYGAIYANFLENRSAGGIVGYNGSAGIIKDCSVVSSATVKFNMTNSTSRTLAPSLGQAIGTSDGTLLNNKGSNTVDRGSLHTETWKEGGFLGIGAKTKTHNQAKYVGGLTGRNG